MFIKIGFPEICFDRQRFDFGKTGIHDEPMLDVISAILTMGFYPNVCYHKEKRKVIFYCIYKSFYFTTSILTILI